MTSFSNSLLQDCCYCLPEIFLALSVLGFLLVGSFKGGREGQQGEEQNRVFRSFMMAALLIVLLTLGLVLVTNTKYGISFHGLFCWDAFGRFFKTLILGAVAVILCVSTRALGRGGEDRFEYPLLILFSTLGMMIMVSSHDLMTVYLSLELQSLPLYVLVAMKRHHPLGVEAAVKYFILGAVASVFILYGISFLYGMTGTTTFKGLHLALRTSSCSPVLLQLGCGFIFAGFAFKLALAPFHMWSPDVYEGSPPPVTLLVATVPKLAALAVILRLWTLWPESISFLWEQITVALIVFSLIIGSLGAFFQSDFKRLLGYSATSQLGYGMMGLLHPTPAGMQSTILYFILYLITTFGIFSILLKDGQKGHSLQSLSDFSGLSQKKPLVAVCFVVLLFSLTGVPPLAGFFTKIGIFEQALQGGYNKLVILGVLTSVLSAAYYLRIIKMMYFDSADPLNAIQQERHGHAPVFQGIISAAPHLVMILSVLVLLGYVFLTLWSEAYVQAVTASLFRLCS